MTLIKNQRPHSYRLRAVINHARFVLNPHSNLMFKGEFNVR